MTVKTRDVPKEKVYQYANGHAGLDMAEYAHAIAHRKDGESNGNKVDTDKENPIITEKYDEMVLCVLADDALKLLGKTASRMEKSVLGSVSFYDDITITHNDFDYMEKHYENYYKPELALPEQYRTEEDNKKIDYAKENFRPFYYTKSYAEDHSRIEMSFACSRYQG